MKKLINELERLNEVLQQLDNNEKTIKELPYYRIFGSESEMMKDLSEVNNRRREALKEKHTILEAIQIFCEKQKMIVSVSQRNLKAA